MSNAHEGIKPGQIHCRFCLYQFKDGMPDFCPRCGYATSAKPSSGSFSLGVIMKHWKADLTQVPSFAGLPFDIEAACRELDELADKYERLVDKYAALADKYSTTAELYIKARTEKLASDKVAFQSQEMAKEIAAKLPPDQPPEYAKICIRCGSKDVMPNGVHPHAWYFKCNLCRMDYAFLRPAK